MTLAAACPAASLIPVRVVGMEQASALGIGWQTSSGADKAAALSIAGASVQCRRKSLLWRGIGRFSCRLVPFLNAPLAPTSSLEPSLRLLPPRFPQPLQALVGSSDYLDNLLCHYGSPLSSPCGLYRCCYVAKDTKRTIGHEQNASRMPQVRAF